MEDESDHRQHQDTRTGERRPYAAFETLFARAPDFSAQPLPERPASVRATAAEESLPDPFQTAPALKLLPHEKPGAGFWRLLYRVAFTLAVVATVAPRSLTLLDMPVHVPLTDPALSARSHVLAEGQLVPYPNAVSHVGSDIGGTVVTLAVAEKEQIKKGDLIAELRSDEQQAALNEAKAKLGEMDAEVRLAEAAVFRARSLQEAHMGSDVAVDNASRDLETAQAKRRRAAASLERRNALLAKTRIVAPIGGTVTSREVNVGDTIRAGTEILTIVDLSQTRIESEVDEFDIGHIKLGDRVRITAEGFPDQSWQGRVQEIPDAVIPRRLRPQDPSRLVDSRVLLVKVELLEHAPLKLGQRLELEINYPAEPADLALIH